MDNHYIRNLRTQKKSVGKRLYAAICLMLVAALLVSTTSYAWLILSQAPEVTDVTTTLGANGNLEIALNTNSLDTYIFTANEDTSIGIESAFDKNSYWGNVVDLSDERYGLQNIQLKPAAPNYKSETQLAVNMGAPFLIAQYGLDGRVTGLSSSGILTNFDSETNKFISSTNYGVRALDEASKVLSPPTVDMDQDDAVLAVYNTYKAIADANSPEETPIDISRWRYDIWNSLLRIYFEHSDAIANGATAIESYTASTVDELETQYLVMQENIDKAYAYLQAMVICRVFADGSNLVAQTKIANLISNNEEDVREYFAAAGITNYNEALDLLDETKDACDGVLGAITSFKTTSAYTGGNISYDQIRNLLLPDLDLNNITFNGNSIGAYDIASYAADCYAYCLLNKTDTLDSLYGNQSYNITNGYGLNFMSALESIHTVAQYEYADKLYYSGYTMTIPSYANNEEIRGVTYKTFMNPYNGHVRHLSWAYPYLMDSTNKGTSTNTEFYKQAYADAKTALLEAFYIPEDPDYSAFITPAFDHILSVANGENDSYSYEYLARLEAGLDALNDNFLNQYGDGIKYYALMFAALISDAEYAEGTVITEPAPDSLYAKVLQAINDGKSADEVLAISGYLEYEYNVGNPPNNYYFKKLIGDPYAYMKSAIANAYARIDALKASKSTGEAISWEEIHSVIVHIIGEDFAPYNADLTEYGNNRANCSIEIDVSSKAIGNIHTLFTSAYRGGRVYTFGFTLSEFAIFADSYDPFIARLISEKTGILNYNDRLGIGIYRDDIPDYVGGNTNPPNLDGGNTDDGSLTLIPNGTTYAFGVDLLFRTNATTANLLLQTIGIDRIYNNDNAPEDWIYSDEYEAAQGQGSRITMDNSELLAALRVAFVDTATGEIYGIAKADSNGYLYLSNDDGSATIKPLDQNIISAITVWIYLDGNIVENLHADTAAATDMKINLQFATDATLNPAFGGNSETPNGGTQTPSNPSDPTNPSNPVVPEPETVYYVESEGNGTYSFYTTKDDGSRDYELTFIGSMNSTQGTVILATAISSSENGVLKIPALATNVSDGIQYSVNIDPSLPFGRFEADEMHITFVPAGNQKVGITDTELRDLFYLANRPGRDNQEICTIDLSGLDTSNVTSMNSMFNGCTNLTDLNLSGIDTSNVTDMSHMFYNCWNLKSLDVSNFNTTKVTDMSRMFTGCDELTVLDLSNFNTAKVKDMNYMFKGCSGLTELDISNFDTAKVTDMQYMFYSCQNLLKLDLSNFNTAKVEDMTAMFKGCSGLTELDVSSFDTAQVTEMAIMFSSCKNLNKLDVTSFNTSNVKRMAGMFEYCNSLAELDLSSFDTTSVTWIAEFVLNCSNLQTIITPKAVGKLEIELPGKYMCEANGNIYTVINKTVPAQAMLKRVDTLPPESGDDVVYSTGLDYTLSEDGSYYIVSGIGTCADTDIVIPSSYNGKSVKGIGDSAFKYGPVTSVDIPNSVTSIGRVAFHDCPLLTSLYIPNSVTSIGDWAFAGCEELASITVEEGNPVYHSDGNCLIETASKTLVLGCKNSIIPDSVTEIGGYAFYGCSSLTSVDIPNSVTFISMFSFMNCDSLTSVDIPDSVTSISIQAFCDCDSLTSVEIGNSVEIISDYVFENCTALSSVYIADSVTYIGNQAFYGCSSLTSITYEGTIEQWELISKDSSEDIEVICANGSVTYN